MTRSYSAGGSRQGAVFTAIVALHLGVIALVASGIGSRGPGTHEEPGPPDVTLLQPQPREWVPVRPELPDLLEPDPYDIPEPVLPRPEYPPLVPELAAGNGVTTATGNSTVMVTTPAKVVPPRLRMVGERLAALVSACYPAGSRRAGEEGRAEVLLRVGRDGRILSWRLLQGTGFPRLDAALPCIIQRLVIDPAGRDGLAIEAEVILPIVFRLG